MVDGKFSSMFFEFNIFVCSFYFILFYFIKIYIKYLSNFQLTEECANVIENVSSLLTMSLETYSQA